MDLSFEQALELYLTLGCQKLTERTRIEYRNDLRQLVGFLEASGVDRPVEVSTKHLRAFLAALERQGLSRFACRRKVAAIRGFFQFLSATQIPFDPAQELIPPERADKHPRYLTTREERALLKACDSRPRDSAIIELILQTGIRLSEAANFTVFDIELPGYIVYDPKNLGRVHIRGKGKKRREVALTFQARRVLENWLSVRPKTSVQSLFVTKFSQPMGQRAIQRTVEKYLRAAGIYDASVHSLRHTFTVRQLAHGAELKQVQATLGHESIKTTALYISAAREHTRHELKVTYL